MAVSGKLIGDTLFSSFPLDWEGQQHQRKQKEGYCTSFPASALNYSELEISPFVAIFCSAGQHQSITSGTSRSMAITSLTVGMVGMGGVNGYSIAIVLYPFFEHWSITC
jgi:hypothetical protein